MPFPTTKARGYGSRRKAGTTKTKKLQPLDCLAGDSNNDGNAVYPAAAKR